MRIVCVSDTHLHHDVVIPDGDILVHAGDLTNRGTLAELAQAAAWLRTLPHAHKVIIAGNHDVALQRDPVAARALLHGLTYLEDEAVTIEGLHFYGSPWQPEFHRLAYNLPRGPALAARWAAIPKATDVLVTHTPPLGILDLTLRGPEVGCEHLRARIESYPPQLHVFGHIHESRGLHRSATTTFVNAACAGMFSRRGTIPVIDVSARADAGAPGPTG